jgi:plasmid maintenance system antidote protein VapI
MHHGEYLAEIQPGLMSKTALAAKLGMARGTLYSFLRGEKRLDPSVATILGELHEDATFWLRLQHEHDLSQVERHRSAPARL